MVAEANDDYIMNDLIQEISEKSKSIINIILLILIDSKI